MTHFLETHIREQQKYEKMMQASVDNAENDLRLEIKFENQVKNKINFFRKQNIFFFKNYVLFSSWKSIFLRFLTTQWSCLFCRGRY